MLKLTCDNFVILNIYWLIISVIIISAQDPFVMLSQGPLRGMKMYTEFRTPVNAFLGIPYAASPIGSLRFASPETHRGWNGTLVASAFAPACLQFSYVSAQSQGSFPGVSGPLETNEDCLYLNVWTPETAAARYESLPVVLFFEGDSGFVSGWPGRFPGQDLAAEGLIVVSASYRLNVFGFFSLGNAQARGNFGLLDQYFALLWVNKNIAAFGGNPGLVTLVGHSAGAASVLLHASSPRTRGLFQRVIAMSGSPLAPWSGLERGIVPVISASHEIARNLGCYSDSVNHMMTCLRGKTSTEILAVFQNQYKGGNWSNIPLPVNDYFLPANDRYLPVEPRDALRTIHVPVLLGYNSHDGVAMFAQWGKLVLDGGYQSLLKYAKLAALPAIIVQSGLAKKTFAFQQILAWHYLDRARFGDSEALLNQLIQLYTDSQFQAPIKETARILSESTSGVPVYLYKFNGHPSLTGNDLLHHSGITVTGASHGSDIMIFFGTSMLSRALGRRLSAADEQFIMSIKKLMIDFIKQGSPTQNNYGYNVVNWRRYNPAEGNMFSLESLKLNTELVPSLGESLFSNLLKNINLLNVDGIDSRRKQNSEGEELRDTSSTTYRSTTFALVGVTLVLTVLLTFCLILLRRNTFRHSDTAEDAF